MHYITKSPKISCSPSNPISKGENEHTIKIKLLKSINDFIIKLVKKFLCRFINLMNENQIAKIKDKKIINGKILYLVAWENYDEDGWVGEELVDPSLIYEFEIQKADFGNDENSSNNIKPLKIFDIVKIDNNPYFLAEARNGKCYIPMNEMISIDSKMVRSFLMSYYITINSFRA